MLPTEMLLTACACNERFIVVDCDERGRIRFYDGGDREADNGDGREIARCPNCGEPCRRLVGEEA